MTVKLPCGECFRSKTVKMSCFDVERWIEMGFDWGYSETVKVLEVNDEWIRIEYIRTKEKIFRIENVGSIKEIIH